MTTNFGKDRLGDGGLATSAESKAPHDIAVALLTGGSDKPYVFGLTTSLTAKGATLDLIGSDELDCSEYRNNPSVKFLNLRGDQRSDVGLSSKDLKDMQVLLAVDRLCRIFQARSFPYSLE